MHIMETRVIVSIWKRRANIKVHKAKKTEGAPKSKCKTPDHSALHHQIVMIDGSDDDRDEIASTTKNSTVAKASVEEVAELKHACDDNPDCVTRCNYLPQAPQEYRDHYSNMRGSIGAGGRSIGGWIEIRIVRHNTRHHHYHPYQG